MRQVCIKTKTTVVMMMMTTNRACVKVGHALMRGSIYLVIYILFYDAFSARVCSVE
jgi:hypothetical protein